MDWFEIRKSTREIIRTDSGAALPTDTGATLYREATRDLLDEYEQRWLPKKREAEANGIAAQIIHRFGKLDFSTGLEWFRLRPDGSVKGTVSSGRATAVPADTPDTIHVRASPELMRAYHATQAAPPAEGRKRMIFIRAGRVETD